jgi:hypothetical protein
VQRDLLGILGVVFGACGERNCTKKIKKIDVQQKIENKVL